MKGIISQHADAMKAAHDQKMQREARERNENLTQGFVMFLAVLLGGGLIVGLLSLIWPNAIEAMLLVFSLAPAAWMHKIK